MSPFLTSAEAALVLRVSVRTLEGWRHNGGGPRFERLGKKIVRYRRADLDAWVLSARTPLPA